MIGEEFILDFFNQFGPFALALLSFTEAIIQPIPPDIMFLPMAYEERGSTSMLLWLWFIVTFASVLGAIVGHTIGKQYAPGFSTDLENHIIDNVSNICLRNMELGACSSQLYRLFRTRYLAGLPVRAT